MRVGTWVTRLLRAALALAVLAAAVGAGTVATAPEARAAAAQPAPEPMSWWGYWTGRWEGVASGGFEFVESHRAAIYGANVVSLHVDTTADGLVGTRRAVEQAQAQHVGVILNWSGVLMQGKCGVYNSNDYDRWNIEMSRVKLALADVIDGVVAMSGFDDLNRRAWCWKSAPGTPNPVPESMRLLALHFPTVQYRGHVWQIQSWFEKGGHHPDLLEGSTMLFPYSYQRENAANEIGTPLCPHEGTNPARGLPEQSNARKTVDDIRGFVDFVNATPRMAGTPILFIPSSTHFGPGVLPATDRGIGCTLEALWHHTRCHALPSGETWARQLSGFLAFNYNSNLVPGTWQWTGVDASPQLDESGRWVGANRTCRFASQGDFRRGSAQGSRGWRYQVCATNGPRTRVRNCKDLTTYDPVVRGGSWHGAQRNALVWDTGAQPPMAKGKVTSRTWIAPSAGRVRIAGRVIGIGPTTPCTAVDDGSAFAVYAGTRQQVWPAPGAWHTVGKGAGPTDFTAEVDVAAGTPIEFAVHRNLLDATCDAIRLTVDIDYTW